MTIEWWQCCGKHLTAKAKCKKCGKRKPTLGFIDHVPEAKPTAEVCKAIDPKREHRNENNRKLSRLPGTEDGKFYTSVMRKDK